MNLWSIVFIFLTFKLILLEIIVKNLGLLVEPFSQIQGNIEYISLFQIYEVKSVNIQSSLLMWSPL
jgi:hypothetical protein